MAKASAKQIKSIDFPADSWDYTLASLEEGIIAIDKEKRLTFFNPAAEQLTGLPRAQVLHRPYAEAFAATPWVSEIVHRTLVSGLSSTAGEGTFRTRSQRPTPVRLTCSPVVSPEGVLLGLILILYNLSHQRELAEEAQQTDRLAQLGVIAAGLAHEIKNPLAGIRGAAQLLQGRLRHDPSATEYAAVMIREIDRLSSLLEQLLQLSPNPRFAPHSVNVHKILTDVLLLEQEAAPNGVKIKTLFDPSLPDVLGDEAQLAQVFRNLIKNGLQALSGRRGGVLTIVTKITTDFHILRSTSAPEQAAEPGSVSREEAFSHQPPSPAKPVRLARFLSVDFADNGPGITPDHFPQLFTPFFTTKNKGTGLGLAISQRIVTQHGGTIRVESSPGQGALFHVYLPVAPL
jgi:two-component system nitrogen regulation sensor histidine kinase GlnL